MLNIKIIIIVELVRYRKQVAVFRFLRLELESRRTDGSVTKT